MSLSARDVEAWCRAGAGHWLDLERDWEIGLGLLHRKTSGKHSFFGNNLPSYARTAIGPLE